MNDLFDKFCEYKSISNYTIKYTLENPTDLYMRGQAIVKISRIEILDASGNKYIEDDL